MLADDSGTHIHINRNWKEVGEILCELWLEGTSCWDCSWWIGDHSILVEKLSHIECTTLGAGEEIYEVARTSSSLGLDGLIGYRANDGEAAGFYSGPGFTVGSLAGIGLGGVKHQGWLWQEVYGG